MSAGRYRIGLDLGQSNDRTAMAAVECVAPAFEVRQIARLPLGLAYVAAPGEPSVVTAIVGAARRIARIDTAQKAAAAAARSTAYDLVAPEPTEGVTVVIDGTGVGAGLTESVRLALGEEAVLRVVEICAGNDKVETVKRANGSRYVRVGKEYLVGRLAGLLETRQIKGAPTPEFVEAQNEARAFQRITNARQHDVYGAKSGAHDDLVIALGLAVLDEIPTDPGGLIELNARLPGHNAQIKLKEGPSVMGWQR